MIISRVRSLFVFALVGFLLSVFTGLWFANHSVSALDLAPNTDSCTFYIDSAKTKVLIDCGDSTKWTLDKKSSNFYSWKSPKGCTLEVTLNPRIAKGDYTVSSISPTACSVFPKPKKNVSIKAAPGGVIEDEQTKAKQAKCEKEDKDYADPPGFCVEKCQDNETRDSEGKCVESESKTSCAIDGIGWMICPVMNFIGDMNDRAYGFISETFLTFDPSLLTDKDTQKAWESFRNIANIFFVLFFLIIIYSQLTSAGISNYGIKRLLPRLIVTAILVNISFFLCQIAVDISNVVGGSIVQLFNQGPFEVTAGGTETTSNTDLPLWKDVIGGTLILGTVAIALVLAVAIGLPGLLILAILVLALVMRKAIILMLVVISPLALVAYLLPNTETWFKKWWKLFYTMLAVFPIIGVVFGASALTAKIINNGADSDPLIQLTALGVSVIPLFAIPAVLKTAMSGAGAIGAKISGGLNRAQGMAGSSAKGSYANSAFARGRNMKKNLRDQYRDRKFAEAVSGTGKGPLAGARRRLGIGVTGRSLTPGGKFAQDRMIQNALAGVTATENKEYAEAMEVERQAQQSLNIGGPGGLLDIAKDSKSSAHAKSAAIERIMNTGSFDDRRQLLEHIASNKSQYSDSHVSTAIDTAYAKGDGDIYGKGFGDKIRNGSISSAADLGIEAVGNAASNKVTAEHWAANGGASKWLTDTVLSSSDPRAMAAKVNLKAAADAAATPGTATAAKLGGDHASSRARL